jgi:hypothetical protein
MLVAGNCCSGRGVKPSLAGPGGAVLTTWILQIWNVASWSVVRCIVQSVVLLAMFSARGVALNVTTASVQLRMLQNSVYLPRGQSYHQLTVPLVCWVTYSSTLKKPVRAIFETFDFTAMKSDTLNMARR